MHIINTEKGTIRATTGEEVIRALAPLFGKPGLSTRRAIDDEEVTTALDRLPSATKRVRVYSSWGFVPNSYKYRAEIQFVEAEIDDDGDWVWTVKWGRAQRSNGRGDTVVVR